MARKTKIVRISEEGRDKGKSFLITEMPAHQSEKWALRALNAIARSGQDIPPEVLRMGWGALAVVGLRSLLTMSFHEAEPLLDEMLDCVEFLPDPKKPDLVRPLDDEDIEEMKTRLFLRDEVWEVHTGFSVAAFLSSLRKAANPIPDSSLSPTSPKPSETPLPADGQP